jgi:hypothetical protein
MAKALKPAAASIFLILCMAVSGWSQAKETADGLYQKMTAVVLQYNPALLSLDELVQESRRLKEPGVGLSIPGMSFGATAGFWNTYTNSPGFAPSITAGLSLSFNDPARALNVYRIRQEKEKAKQDWESAKNAALSELFSKVREIQKLKSRGRNLVALQKYLQDYNLAAKTQGGDPTIGPDKMWDLMERLTNVQTDLDTVDGQLETTMMETAMRLGGSAWQDLLQLLRQIDTPL